MLVNRIVEYVFFFGFMAIVGFLIWKMISPFVSALALSTIIVTICYPLYEKIKRRMPRQNASMGALVTTLVVLVIVILPLFFILQSLINEAASVYNLASEQEIGIAESMQRFEQSAQSFIPGFEFNYVEYIRQGTEWLAGNVGAIFASTASTIFLFFISMVGSFYLFRDGKEFTKKLVIISPLPDDQDEKILKRMAISIRSVLTGTILIALIQGTLTAVGLSLVGFERAVLWGTIAAFGALIPSVGTSIVLVPAIIYLLVTGQYVFAVILGIWGMFAVGLIDNLLGPYLMSRGNKMHPFVILIAVLGGISVFGPLGFIVGPVIVSLFIVLLELYSTHISAAKDE